MPDDKVNGKLVVTDKIGIGIEEPIAQLHIASSTLAPSQTFLESGGALLKLSVDASGAAIGTDNAFPLNIQTDSSSRISINNAGKVTISGPLSVQKILTVNGNVGIGTPNPAYTLDVNGILNVTEIYKNGVPWTLTTSEIADNAITATKIQDGSVGQAELAIGAVTELKIANNAVTEAKLATNAVTALKIADSSIGTAKLADGAVNGLKIALGAVGTDKLADGAVTATKITNLSVGTTKLADGAVTPEKLAVSVQTTLNGALPKTGGTLTGSLTISGTLTANSNVSISTAATGAGLEINKSTTNNLALLLNSSGAGWGSGAQFKNTAANAKTYGIYSGSDGKWHFADVDSSADRLVVDRTGNIIAPKGAILNGLAVGVDPPSPIINPPWPYETISTLDPNFNLRLHSNSGIFFHVGNGNAPSVGIDGNGSVTMVGKLGVRGNLTVEGDMNVSGRIVSNRGLSPGGNAIFNRDKDRFPYRYPTPNDAQLLFYDYGGGNWAGIGVDTSGYIWIRAGWDDANSNILLIGPDRIRATTGLYDRAECRDPNA